MSRGIHQSGNTPNVRRSEARAESNDTDNRPAHQSSMPIDPVWDDRSNVCKVYCEFRLHSLHFLLLKNNRKEKVYMQYQFLDKPAVKTPTCPLTKTVTWGHSSVIFLGTIPSELLLEYVRGPPLVLGFYVVQHDEEEAAKMNETIFGTLFTDQLLGTCTFGRGMFTVSRCTAQGSLLDVRTLHGLCFSIPTAAAVSGGVPAATGTGIAGSFLHTGWTEGTGASPSCFQQPCMVSSFLPRWVLLRMYTTYHVLFVAWWKLLLLAPSTNWVPG